MMAQSLKKRNIVTIEVPKPLDNEESQTEQQSAIQIAKLRSTITALMKQCKQMKEEAEMMTQERDFYYEKLRKVEEFCEDHDEEPAYENILSILYETDEARGFVSPDEAELLAQQEEECDES